MAIKVPPPLFFSLLTVMLAIHRFWAVLSSSLCWAPLLGSCRLLPKSNVVLNLRKEVYGLKLPTFFKIDPWLSDVQVTVRNCACQCRCAETLPYLLPKDVSLRWYHHHQLLVVTQISSEIGVAKGNEHPFNQIVLVCSVVLEHFYQFHESGQLRHIISDESASPGT